VERNIINIYCSCFPIISYSYCSISAISDSKFKFDFEFDTVAVILSAFDYAKPVSDIYQTGFGLFGFSGFLHSIRLAKLKPVLLNHRNQKTYLRDGFPEIVHLFTPNYLLPS